MCHTNAQKCFLSTTFMTFLKASTPPHILGGPACRKSIYVLMSYITLESVILQASQLLGPHVKAPRENTCGTCHSRGEETRPNLLVPSQRRFPARPPPCARARRHQSSLGKASVCVLSLKAVVRLSGDLPMQLAAPQRFRVGPGAGLGLCASNKFHHGTVAAAPAAP